MSDFKSRLFDEHDQLNIKVDKLTEFMTSDKYAALPTIDRDDLRKQRGFMNSYLTVLRRRVSRQCT